MLIARRISRHLTWLIASLVLMGLLTAWWLMAMRTSDKLPGGGSSVGLTLGLIGGLLIAFEMALVLKKRLRSKLWMMFQTRLWMKAHIWLGLLTFPILLLHSGIRWGGWLSATLLALLALVWLSGIYGLILQQFLPKIMLDDVPGEAITSQVGHIVGKFSSDARRMMALHFDLDGDEATPRLTMPSGKAVAEKPKTPYISVGSVRAHTKTESAEPEKKSTVSAERLLESYVKQISPFLEEGDRLRTPLSSSSRSRDYFQTLKAVIPTTTHETMEALEGLCEQRRQLDSQARLQFWLHNWLLMHLPLSWALFVLMFLHVFVALKYI